MEESVLNEKLTTYFSFYHKKSGISEEDKKLVGKKANLASFVKDLRSNLSNCKYRKVLEDIVIKQNLFEELPDYWKLRELKIRSMLKIVSKKLIKYDKNVLTSQPPNKCKSIETWLVRCDVDLDKWLVDLNSAVEDKELQLELILQLYLETFYTYALFMKNEGNIADCAAFLALGERLVKAASETMRNPNTLNISQKTYLFISSLLIADNSFENSTEYQSACLKLAFRELFLRIDNDEGMMFESLPKVEKYYLTKIFNNIVMCFYHRGVCEENKGNIMKAIEAYKQGRWFAMKFVEDDFPELAHFIKDVEKRGINYHLLIKNINKKNEEFKEENDNETKKLETQKKDMILSNVAAGNYTDMHKFEKLINKLETLRGTEFEFRTENKQREYLLSTVYLTNSLLSDKFNDILKEMRNLDINKMDKEIMEKIQKRLNKINIENKFMSLNSEKQRPDKSSQDFKNSYNTLVDKSLKEATTAFASPKEFVKHTRKISSKLSSEKIKELSTQKVGFKAPYCKYRPNSVEKIECDKFIFSNTYKKKKEFVKKINKKEIDFQKKLFNLKKYEKIVVSDHDPKKISNEVETFFKRAKSVKPVIFSNFNENGAEALRSARKEKINKRMENSMIMSLDSKNLTKYLENKKKEKSIKNSFQEKLLAKAISQKQNSGDKEQLIKINSDSLKKVERELNQLHKHESSLMRVIKSHSLSPKRKPTSRSTWKKGQKIFRDEI